MTVQCRTFACSSNGTTRHDNKLDWHDPAVVDAHPFKYTESIVSAASALNCAKRHCVSGLGPLVVSSAGFVIYRAQIQISAKILAIFSEYSLRVSWTLADRYWFSELIRLRLFVFITSPAYLKCALFHKKMKRLCQWARVRLPLPVSLWCSSIQLLALYFLSRRLFSMVTFLTFSVVVSTFARMNVILFFVAKCVNFSKTTVLKLRIGVSRNSWVQWLAVGWAAEVRFPAAAGLSSYPPPLNRLWDPPVAWVTLDVCGAYHSLSL
jgi:hypothetical protein